MFESVSREILSTLMSTILLAETTTPPPGRGQRVSYFRLPERLDRLNNAGLAYAIPRPGLGSCMERKAKAGKTKHLARAVVARFNRYLSANYAVTHIVDSMIQ